MPSKADTSRLGLPQVATPGHDERQWSVTTVAGMRVHYADLPSLETEVRNIFEQKIYHFQSDSPRPLVIDGGAHIGLATLYFKKICPDAKVICFEPDQAAAELLRRNLSDNGLTDVELVPAGLAEQTGTATFVPDGADGGSIRSAASAQGRSIAGAVTIPVVRLSDYVTSPVDFLKLNIEGQEGRVLRELEATGKLSQIRKLVLEYHSWPAAEQSLGDILQLLARNGFRYVVHDFDARTNPASKPPFRIRRQSPWFCLVYAERLDDAGTTPQAPAMVDLGDLRRLSPMSRVFGLDRGTPVDRHYIERFLEERAPDVRGRVLEIGEDVYTRKYGGDRVRQADVLFTEPGHRRGTIVGDLTRGDDIPENAFDCIILTQTLLVIYDIHAAVRTLARILKSGGVVLATVPGISQISRYDMDRWGDYWRFTSLSARRLFEECFAPNDVTIESHGNVLAAVAFLHGLAKEELTLEELECNDPDYPVTITIRAVKRGASG